MEEGRRDWDGVAGPVQGRDQATQHGPLSFFFANFENTQVVCFLDYNDFFSYNFPIADPLPDNVPRPSLDIGEATRLILMKIHVTKIEPPGENDGQELPVVYFKGFSRSLDAAWDENANSDLRGEINIHGGFPFPPARPFSDLSPFLPIHIYSSFIPLFSYNPRRLANYLGSRSRPPHQRRRGPLDHLLHLLGPGALALRERADRRRAVGTRRHRQLVRQGLRPPQTQQADGLLEDQRPR